MGGVKVEGAAEGMYAVANDIELSISQNLNPELFTVTEPGAFVAPGRLITDIVKALDSGALTLETTDDEAVITSGRSQFKVRLFPVDEFPTEIPIPTGSITIKVDAFVEALRQVVPSASEDTARPVLTGVLLAAEASGLRFVATDSYRLAVRDVSDVSVLDEGQSVLVPGRSLGELQRIIGKAETVVLHLGATEAVFEVGLTRLTTRLLDAGGYPNYKGLLPTSFPNRLEIAKDALADAVKRVSLVVRDATTPVRLDMTSGGVALRVVSPDLGEGTEDVDAKYEGEAMSVAFNPKYLLASLEACTTETVIIEAADGVKPALVHSSEDDGFRYIIMPVRVS